MVRQEKEKGTNLLRWFREQHGTLDTSSMGIVNFLGHGRGAIALKDIPEDYTIFSLSRDLTLSTRTSTLPTLMDKGWKEHGLHEGWVGLILCMMWEESRGPESKWSGYLAALPEKFDTPMFWPEDDLKELQGTAVVDKIGRADAERDYHEKLIPAVKSRPDLFPEDKLERYFSLERYHVNGSRILSRSFHVERWKGGHTEDQGVEDDEADGNGMDVDPQEPPVDTEQGGDATEQVEEVQLEGDEELGDEDQEDPADVAMVPMADMLNARFESENAKLFYEERELKMVTTKPVEAGEQIWNTYGDPPNSDLLRRYGHVDVVPLRPPLSGMGNPRDIVEVRADLIVSAVSKKVEYSLQERVDWWLEEAEDDVFILRTDCELPEELVSFERLLFLSEDEWIKTAKKSKLPKPKVDPDVLTVAIDVLSARLKEYPTSIEEDEKLLSADKVESLSLNKKHAVIVRLGEKRILQGTLKQLRARVAASAGSTKKRGRDEEKGGKGKKARK
ncbi:SET domain-containing protein [Dichomitus squalens LYAD-421 SS1]|uniref:SET domain-containing protein n=1 Tax=Dichomitus squalens (strain LYAD-421) TaxID=732165 RepID=UPI0004414757|nr:SET domain-containing protein [Dichomitus squalens LYAD-421 SS1]EJF65011.1 SET domain-containing protein [Dichomitus squalens LYAD-421 SS1]